MTRAIGARHGRVKYTDEQVLEMRARYASGETPAAIARSMGARRESTWSICVGRYRHHLHKPASYVPREVGAKGTRGRANTNRFAALLAPENEHGCRLWIGTKTKNGYGRFKVDGRCVTAHRFAWEQARGEVPPGLCVLHDCDVNYPVGSTDSRACCNPAHLFLGTNADNVADRQAKGRSASGDRYWSGKRRRVSP